ncbi:hypothetical protein NKR23_g5455 [Pleurostoma richardsiae]|uniref:Zn(2)-C6 fungal-type domain-containing protein n=1 Tax=Pleurostoma richardsiae TaxID=41990 RepID=A0AA38RGH4_9PEZI|nr:hypothetical protein NKR23_g5455 [Pleurostoma richardsiae]
MSSPIISRQKKKRLLRSCNGCRASKTRCVPSDNDDDVCQRCAWLKKQCVFSEAKVRSSRASTGPSRVSKMEENIRQIYSMLQERGQQAQPNVEPAVSPSIRANRDVYAENVQLSQAPSLQEPLGNHTELHAALELELRKTLATRLIVNAERGLDLLQGLLIYLLWYHFHGDHASRMGILAHIALSLALELAENGQSDSESQRALLVAFLVSSSTLVSVRKSFSLKQTCPVYSVCQSLTAADKNSSPEMSLCYAVQLQRIADSIGITFGYDSKQRPGITAESVQLAVEGFRSQLQSLQTSFSSKVDDANKASLSLMYDATMIHLYEVSLHMDTGPSQHDSSKPPSPTRLNLLLTCLDVTKKFLDNYLGLPRQLLKEQTLLGKAHLGHAMAVLIKLALYTGTAIEPSQLRQACQVSHYLGAIASLSADLSSTPPYAQRPDSFRHFEQKVTNLLNWYERIESQGPGAEPAGLVGMSTMEMVNTSALEEQGLGFDIGNFDFMFLNGAGLWN